MLASALNLQLGWGAKWKVLNESIAVALFVSIGAARMILAALTPKFELPLRSIPECRVIDHPHVRRVLVKARKAHYFADGS